MIVNILKQLFQFMIICFCVVEMWNKAISGNTYGSNLLFSKAFTNSYRKNLSLKNNFLIIHFIWENPLLSIFSLFPSDISNNSVMKHLTKVLVLGKMAS